MIFHFAYDIILAHPALEGSIKTEFELVRKWDLQNQKFYDIAKNELGILYQVKLNMYNMLKFRAPTDCVQYFTGTSGSVLSYNHAGGQLLHSQVYNNCIRTEKG